MKATLEYDLPDEQDEFQNAINGANWRNIVWKVDHFLRSNTKHAPDSVADEELKAYYKVKDELYRLLNDNNLVL